MQGDLFGCSQTASEITSGQIVNGKGSYNFRKWAIKIFLGRPGSEGNIGIFTHALIRAGIVRDSLGALEYLREIWEKVEPENATIAVTDFKDAKLQAINRLKKSLEETWRLYEERSAIAAAAAIGRSHGTFGHVMAPKILTGGINGYSNKREIVSGQESFISTEELLKIAGLRIEEQQQLFEPDVIRVDARLFQGISSGSEYSKSYVSELRNHWIKMSKEVVKGNTWYEQFRNGEAFIQHLRDMLIPIFGEYVFRIEKLGDPYLAMLTMMSWVSLILYAWKVGRRILFTEVPVLAHSCGVSGGRMDAVEVISVKGRHLTRDEREKVQRLAEANNGTATSVGKLLQMLEETFHGNPFSVKIIDWKFAVGDGRSGNDVISTTDILSAPLGGHKKQLARYATLGTLDFALQKAEIDDVWRLAGMLEDFEIVYFLPTQLPILHSFIFDPRAKEAEFNGTFVKKWRDAKARAFMRTTSNRITTHIINLFNNGCSDLAEKSPSGSLLFPKDKYLSPSLPAIIEKSIKFADHGKVFEIRGIKKDGTEKLTMHLDKLIEAIGRGEVEVEKSFNWERGGKVTCLPHPKKDRRPSMHLFLGSKIFKCFSCGACGTIAEESIPMEIVVTAKIMPGGRQPRFGKQSEKLVISPRHQEVMSIAQDVLNAFLLGSDGEKYLADKRRLDPHLAHQLGVGFCWDPVFFDYMLESGVAFDELVFYGFIGFSNQISTNNSLVPFLRKRGMREGSWKREVSSPIKKEDKSLGLPYSILGGRITFPLKFSEAINNFYGRDALGRGDRMKHRKLSVENTSSPHGAFNASVLYSDNFEEAIVVEAPLDALSLIQMGYENTLSVIGIWNYAILWEITASGKNVAVALDNDEMGKCNTTGWEDEKGKHRQGVVEWFEANGAKGRTRDFTEAFVMEHAEYQSEEWDDWNTLWMKFINPVF